MEQNNYKPEPPVKREYNSRARLLLIFAAALGIVMSTVMLDADVERLADFAMPYALFWGVYLAGFYFAAWERAKHNMWGWGIVLAVILLFVRYAVYRERYLQLANFAVIPLLLMLHAVVCAYEPNENDLRYIPLYFMGWFVKPFTGIPRFFGATGSVFSKERSGGRKNVLMGIAIGIPLAAALFAMLAGADGVLGAWWTSLMRGAEFFTVVRRCMLAVITAMLFYSFIFNHAFEADKQSPSIQKTRAMVPAVTACIAIGMVLAVYAAFAYVQFFYLTGLRGLPEGLTYSEYAVSGFSELIWVAAINLGLYALTLTFVKEGRCVRPMLAGLLAGNAVILYSAIMRLCLYIDAYGLTVRRILPMWFMIFLAAVTVLAAIRLLVPRIKLLRTAAAMLIVWYVALNFVNMEAMVVKSIIEKADARGYMKQEDVTFIKYDLEGDGIYLLWESKYGEEAKMQ